ncbi:hypothetical protein F4778DRAFT_365372 [Xylariomycetidae sp. FL2044]|nr:hypothetical protein F4778DRAFT_365372 [Xylariomycetidae sp. FL2044]
MGFMPFPCLLMNALPIASLTQHRISWICSSSYILASATCPPAHLPTYSTTLARQHSVSFSYIASTSTSRYSHITPRRHLQSDHRQAQALSLELIWAA